VYRHIYTLKNALALIYKSHSCCQLYSVIWGTLNYCHCFVFIVRYFLLFCCSACDANCIDGCSSAGTCNGQCKDGYAYSSDSENCHGKWRFVSLTLQRTYIRIHHVSEKKSPFLYSLQLRQMSSNFANALLKHTSGNLKQITYTQPTTPRFVCLSCTL